MARCAERLWTTQTLYNRWQRQGGKSVFLRMTEGLSAPEASERKTVMIDATYPKAHRTTSSLRMKKQYEHQASCHY
ncbi:hypothetical protein GRO01_26590 [Gluconobacter roseus NBRC 3990]|uniref:Transposase n=1 Tax=Gluconobacter roseus NBRC 3990 TaxID=1307950 RepID=A0A4Y3M931_9PROT|nr:transposase [Gluconobacter roseus NBRC 3990]GEB05083.1 hypothetical protein GRO01_26590 [Gluconobacter roseus NBRC 3990]GLP94428.1 hypothetical protein GCM10007871_24060 [Gluconobacter roseus NBRC 3990]